MLCYRDKTFCVSHNCTNKCGRKLTGLDRQRAAKLNLPIAQALFCGGGVLSMIEEVLELRAAGKSIIDIVHTTGYRLTEVCNIIYEQNQKDIADDSTER